jgi:ABC-type Fe3+/spermidine/putrescine transport system ATPase subunit
LLLDEPLSNLDARIRLQMRHEIRAIQRKLGVTAVLVTHDREEAMVMADQVVILDQGQIAQIGTPEEVFQHPKTPYVASFMGAENIIHCEADVSHAGVQLTVPGLPDTSIQCQAPLLTSGPAQVHFRSEAARLHLPGEPAMDSLQLPGRVTQVTYLGGGYRCEIQTHCGTFFIDHDQTVAHDQAVAVHVPATALHVYPRESARQPMAHH